MIDRFDGPHSFLSNFYPSPVLYDGIRFPTSEHAFQAAKSLNMGVRRQISMLPSPADAKRFGRNIHLRPGWDRLRLAVMEDILREKFSSPSMRRNLMSTGTHELVEGNWWNDTFWGVCNGKGENHLGKILMKLRKEWE